MNRDFYSLVANHLWQSTLFGVAAGLLSLVFRGNRASVRYGLWLAASLKFLVPFSLAVVELTSPPSALPAPLPCPPRTTGSLAVSLAYPTGTWRTVPRVRAS